MYRLFFTTNYLLYIFITKLVLCFFYSFIMFFTEFPGKKNYIQMLYYTRPLGTSVDYIEKKHLAQYVKLRMNFYLIFL